MTAPTVQCESVYKRFGEVVAVSDVSFHLEQGEVLSVLGPSGSGKTTMLRLIAGFERVDAGDIWIRGVPASARGHHLAPERRNVGMVFQDYALFPHLTVSQNVSFGLRRMPAAQREKRLAELLGLARLGGLDGRYPHELSGGQQQRVALARTLAPHPVAVLLDEPFSNLDAAMRLAVRREVEGILRENRITTIFVTHEREEAFAMADRIAVMRDGKFDQIDTPDGLYHSPVTPFVATMSGTGDFLTADVRGERAVTEIGELPCARADGFAAGGPALLLVRTDDFDLTPAPDGEVEVVGREFRGDGILLTVRLPSGETLRCRQHHLSKLAPGTRVKMKPSRSEPFIAFGREES